MSKQQGTISRMYAYEAIGKAIENLQAMHDQISCLASDSGAGSLFVSSMDVRSALDDLCIDLGIVQNKLPSKLVQLYALTQHRSKFTLVEVVDTFNEARGIARPRPQPAYSPFVDGGE